MAKAGNSFSYVYITVATCIAVGNVSLDDYDLFTWSLGCTTVESPNIYIALLDSTSLVFILDCVPEPVYHTTNGNS